VLRSGHARSARHVFRRCVEPGWSAVNQRWTRPCRRPWRTRSPARRTDWNAMSYRIGTCISFPWWPRRKAAQPRTKRGTKPQGAFVHVPRAPVLRVTRSDGHVLESVSRRNHHSSRTLATIPCAASVTSGRRALPAGNAGWYCSRDVSDPLLRPGDRSRPVPRGRSRPGWRRTCHGTCTAHSPAASHVTCPVRAT